MLNILSVIYQSPITHGAITGAVVAAGVDLQAFRSWKTFNDIHTYNWGVAAFRWMQGAVVGAISATSF